MRYPRHAAALTLLLLLTGSSTTQAIERRVIDLPSRDVVYRATDGFLYLGFETEPGSGLGAITSIDPATGITHGGFRVGGVPRRMQLADDGKTLYVTLSDRRVIEVVDLETQQVAHTIELGDDRDDQPLKVDDFVVQPGNPDVVAVSLFVGPFTSPRHRGVVIFDHGVARPVRVESFLGPNRLVFSTSDPSHLYGYVDESSGGDFIRLQVSADGVTERDRKEGLLPPFLVDQLLFRDGKVYTDEGDIVDPEALTSAGLFDVPHNNQSVAFALDEERAYFITTDATRLYELDRNTLAPIEDQPFLAEGGLVDRLIRWGTDGLAYVVQDSDAAPGHLVILRDIHEPPVCEVAVTIEDGRDPATQDQVLDYAVRVFNLGPDPADGVVLRDRLPLNTTLQYLTARNIFLPPVDSSGVVVVPLGVIAPGDTEVVHVGVVPHGVGTIEDVAEVATRTLQATTGSDRDVEQTEIRPPGWDDVDLWTKIVPPLDPVIGQPFHYTLWAGNYGPGPVATVFLYHQMYLIAAEPISATTSTGSCDVGSGTVNCVFPGLAPGESVAVEVTAVSRAPLTGDLTSQIQALDSPFDRDASNNEVAVSVTVRGDPADQLGLLIDQVQSYGLPRGVERPLVADLEKARRAWLAGDADAACAAVLSFLERVARLAPNKLSDAQASALTSSGTLLRSTMGCPYPGAALARTGTVEQLPRALALSRRSATADPRPRLRLALPSPGRVKVDVIDVTGRIVRTLLDEARAAGYHDVAWEGEVLGDGRARSGVYFVVASAHGERAVARISILR